MSSAHRIFGNATRRTASLLLLVLGCLVAPLAGAADPFPSKPLRLIIPFPPGGGADISGRIFAAELSKKLGQPIVIDNRAGANGKLGVQALLAAPGDGYTLLLATISTHATEPDLYSAKPPYDPVKDFAPVALINNMSLVLVAHPDLPIKNLADFVALAKAAPGKLTYSSAGLGNIGHLAMELFTHEAGLKLTHVPYKGAAEAVSAVISHTVDAFFDVYPSELPHIKAGKVRPLAISLTQRLPQTPDVPTATEAGYPRVVASAWTGLVTSAGTPPEVIARLNAAANEALASPDLQAQLRDRGTVAAGQNTAEQFRAFVVAETQKWSALQRSIGLVK